MVEVFVQSLLDVNVFLNHTFLMLLPNVRQTWMTQAISPWEEWINLKGFCYSYVWSCKLCKGQASFCTGLTSRKLWGFLFMLLGWPYFIQCFAFFSSINHILCLYAQIFEAISSNARFTLMFEKWFMKKKSENLDFQLCVFDLLPILSLNIQY